MKRDIENAPNHILGDHSGCAKYFCNGPATPDEKNNYRLMFNDPIYRKLVDAMGRLKINAKSLIYDLDSNSAEQYNSVLVKYTGGKRINYSLKNSYAARCAAAVSQFNTGRAHNQLHQAVFKCPPNKYIETMELNRLHKIHKKKERKQSKPYSKVHKPAAKTDNNYGTDTCEKPDMTEEDFKEAKAVLYKKLELNRENRQNIERSTIEQSENEEWLLLRRDLLTASNFGKIIRARPSSYANYTKTLLYSTGITANSLNYGKQNEPIAVKQLELQEKLIVQPCGLFIHPSYNFLGATPDGLIDEDGILEIKCPYSVAGMDPEEAAASKAIPYFKMSAQGTLQFNQKHVYFYQVQGQLEITNRSYCLFGMFTSSDFPLKVIKIQRDKDFFKDEMLPKLTFFYENHMLPEIVDSRIKRGRPIRNATEPRKKKQPKTIP